MQGSGNGYEMSINMNIQMISEIVSVNSPSHPSAFCSVIEGRTASGGFTFGKEPMTKDLIVMIEVLAPHEPRVCLEEDEEGNLAAMVTLFPRLNFREVLVEVVFLVDRSGSMSGSRIEHARKCLKHLVECVPDNCYFNVIGFGSSFEKSFQKSTKKTKESLRESFSWISGIEANLGGTELVQPLREILTSKHIRGYPRQVFVLTDGQVSNTAEVIQLVETYKDSNRVFSLGLGESVSHHLVEGIARAGRGTSQFVINEEEMSAKMMKQLKEAIQPALTNVTVDWGVLQNGHPVSSSSSSSIVSVGGRSLLGYESPSASKPPLLGGSVDEQRVEVHQAPFNVPPVFHLQHFLIYGMYPKNKKLPSSVKVTAQSPDGPLSVELPVDLSKLMKGKLIHTLAARTLIRDLEEGRSWITQLGYGTNSLEVKQEIIRLGTKYQLVSQFTSFIAIEDRSKSEGSFYDFWIFTFYFLTF